jgi:hypothetical protein
LNDYDNIKLREKIEKEMFNKYILYSEKLKNLNKLLHDLVKDKVKFIGDKNYYKLIQEVSTCIVKDSEKCEESANICALTENGACNLIIPKVNLITGKENEPIYFLRMADELIRYNRIKSFMLKPQVFLSFGNIEYNLRENEVIMVQSLLTQEYFDTLVPASLNKYVKHISYDEAEPSISNTYENVVSSLNESIREECIKNEKQQITSSLWRKCFPSNYTEIEYERQANCTFEIIIDLIERKTSQKMTINSVKNELFNEYKKYLDRYHDKIVDILIIEGKKTLGNQVKSDKLSFLNLLYVDNYFLTLLDMWLLIQKYEIPTIFISQKFILQTEYKENIFLGYGTQNDKFAFIVVPGFRNEIIPTYKIIVDEKKDYFISLSKIDEECKSRVTNAIEGGISINSYLDTFIKPKTTTYKKKQPIKLILEEELKVEEPKVEELKVEEPKVEEPKVEEPKVEEPKVKKSKVTKLKKTNIILQADNTPVVEPLIQEQKEETKKSKSRKNIKETTKKNVTRKYTKKL